MKTRVFITLLFLVKIFTTHAQVWQWSVRVDSVISNETNDYPQAFLWIPEKCKKVKAVVFTQHNMVEEGILEHPAFRRTMAELDIAEVWITPGLNMTFDFNKDAGEDFIYMMKLLAEVSGYSELADVPVIPMGHSALASFPWNFAAWNPGRTLALVSIKGDAPLTNLTGSGRPNPDWGSQNIDGIPALFIMGEYEWWEDRIKPAFDYIAKHPESVISLFADAGHGHFDYSDDMIGYVCLFIKKAALARLPQAMPIDKPDTMKKLKPQQGWLMDRWHKDSLPLVKPAPYALYKGDRRYASWVFDKETADMTEQLYAKARGKMDQYIGFRQNGQVLIPQKTHANYHLRFIPLSDGISFRLSAFFSDTSRLQPAPAFASTPLIINRICGPVKKINDSTFQLSFYRLGFNNPKRSNDIWLLASNKGDEKYKSAVQQLDMRFPLINNDGVEQVIGFPDIRDQKRRIRQLKLSASSSANVPVYYYVKEGPATVKGGILYFTTIPPRSKFPVKVTVVAWQYGMQGKLKSARSMEQSFYIVK